MRRFSYSELFSAADATLQGKNRKLQSGSGVSWTLTESENNGSNKQNLYKRKVKKDKGPVNKKEKDTDDKGGKKKKEGLKKQDEGPKGQEEEGSQEVD